MSADAAVHSQMAVTATAGARSLRVRSDRATGPDQRPRRGRGDRRFGHRLPPGAGRQGGRERGFAGGATNGRDGYGHGTHIAGIVAARGYGNSDASGASGMAPGAHLLNLKVLKSDGSGKAGGYDRGNRLAGGQPAADMRFAC